MSDEIAEFLRRAAQRRAEQMQQQQREAQQRALQSQAAVQQQQQPAPRRVVPTIARPQVVEAEIIDDEPIALRAVESRLEQNVARDLDTRAFAARAGRMAEATEQADERMDEHVHRAFDHKLGRIGVSTESISAAAMPVVDNEMLGRKAVSHPILKLLRKPESIRNAVIMGELLKRPEQNW